MKVKLSLPQRERILKRVLKGESVTKVCQEAGISRVLLYRWLKRYKELQVPELNQSSKLTQIVQASVSPKKGIISKRPQYDISIRIRAIQEVISHKKSVSVVCRELNISKTIFYRWLKRYHAAGTGKVAAPVVLPAQTQKTDTTQKLIPEKVQTVPQKTQAIAEIVKTPEFDENKALAALENIQAFIDRYPNQVPQEYEQLILDAAAHFPELSAHKLIQVLPLIGNRPVVGHHGIQNVLRRHDLNTYEKRLNYAAIKSRTPLLFKPTIGSVISLLIRLFKLPLQTRSRLVAFVSAFLLPLTLSVIFLGFINYLHIFIAAPSLAVSIGYIFSSAALFFGFFFFLYSFKYYMSIGLILVFSRYSLEKKSDRQITLLKNTSNGLVPDVSHISLDRRPFVSIHLPTYNERWVVNRLLEAITSLYYENFEVIVCDDSTDNTKDIVLEWKNHPKIKILHRESRQGYKGGALGEALKIMDPRTEFVMVFDADFLPYPDTVEQFLRYFKSVVGSLDQKMYSKSNVAVLQGYQWHVLNKSENWITRGVRTEYAGSYVIERSSAEIYNGIKQIAGSVFMIRADIIKKYGWGTSITEDFELTLRLYADGYRVIYTPYVQAPSECVSTLKRLVRQRMRWAEGHSHNIKRMFRRVLGSSSTTVIEKIEFLYLSPYYLQSFLFLIGTFSWFTAEVVFRVNLPFWTSVWGWSLVLTNLFSLPLMNLVGMFLEEAEEKDYLGLFSFVLLTYIIAPFQAYAAVKGFIETSEGPWFRTPKTGKITDVFRRGRFYQLLRDIFGQPAVAESRVFMPKEYFSPQLLTLSPTLRAVANNQFDNVVVRKGRMTWTGKSVLAILLSVTTTLLYFSKNVKLVYATNWASPLKLSIGTGDASFPAFGNYLSNSTSYSTGSLFLLRRNNANLGTNNHMWFSNFWPTGSGGGPDAVIPGGNYYVQIAKSGNGTNTAIMNILMQLLLTSQNGTSLTQIGVNSYQMNAGNADNTLFQFLIGNLVGNNITQTNKNRFALRFSIQSQPGSNANTYIELLVNNSGRQADLVLPGTITVPEIPKSVIFIILVTVIPMLPALVSGKYKKRYGTRNIFQEIIVAWQDFMRILLGLGEEGLDELPV